jgi:hypothetical protein
MTGTRIQHPNAFGRALAEALGLKHVTKLVVTIVPNQLPIVEATVWADSDALLPVLKRFELNPTALLESEGAPPEARPPG